MKKTIIVICCILLFVITGNVSTQRFSKDFFEELEKDLNNLEDNILKQNTNVEDLKQEAQNIQNKWNDKNNTLAYYIEHDELEKVGNKLCRIYAGIEVNKIDETIIEIEECNFIIEHIKKKELFKLVNIF